MGTQPNVYRFPTIEVLTSVLRQYILQAQNAGLQRHAVFKIAIAGDSMPKTLAQAVLAQPQSPDDLIQFSKWEIFFAEEMALPLDHEHSNHALLKCELLDKIPKALGKPIVHTIDSNYLDDMEELSYQYEQLLVRSFARRESVKTPIFDLILLECGQDGHTCSLFPSHALLEETEAWIAGIEDSPRPPLRRITLSLPVIIRGIKVAFIATGAGKRGILKKIFEDGSGLPCALVNNGCGDKCSWFVDYSAVDSVTFPENTRFPKLQCTP